MPALDGRRFLFVTGKGGTGKTTVSAALALALAERGRRVLLASPATRERLWALVGAERTPGTSIELLRPNLWGVVLSPEIALREYGALVLKSERLVELLFDNRYVKGFLGGAPGLKEWALLGKAWYHAIETLPDASPRFDVVVFDGPATGHGLDMLRVPKVILAAAPPGRLRVDAERAFAFFRDARTSGLVVVTLPEEMPTNETLDLVGTLRRDLGLPIATIVVNNTLAPLFAPAEESLLAAFADRPALDPSLSSAAAALRADRSTAALAAAGRRALAERVQAESAKRLAGADVAIATLPRLPPGPIEPGAILAFGRALLAGDRLPSPTR